MKNRGFTLIEMLVTVLIFSLIVGACIGVFVSAIRTQKYSLTYQQLLAQTSYAMEYMTRAIRMARINEGPVCFGMDPNRNYKWMTEDYIEFATYHNQCWKFFLEGGQLKVGIDKDGNGFQSNEKYFLISDDFDVKNFNIVVSGDGTDQEQPRATIFMEIQGRGRSPQPKIRIQTTVSQRNLDTD